MKENLLSMAIMMLAVTLCSRQALFRPVAAFSMLPTTTSTTRISIARFTSQSDESANGKSEDRLAEYRNKNNVRDQVFSAISKDGSVKVTAGTVRNIVNDMMIMHTMTEVPADAMGRLVTCAVLVSNGMQKEQTLQITMKGDGPLRGAMAISTGKGEVRGYVGSPALGSMTLQEAVGKGAVQVVKNHPEWPNPYNGITAIRNGDIDRDVGKCEGTRMLVVLVRECDSHMCFITAGNQASILLNQNRDRVLWQPPLLSMVSYVKQLEDIL